MSQLRKSSRLVAQMDKRLQPTISLTMSELQIMLVAKAYAATKAYVLALGEAPA
jgi:hypothetical protein